VRTRELNVADRRFVMLSVDAGARAEADIVTAVRDGGGFVILELLNGSSVSVLVTDRSDIVVADLDIDDDPGPAARTDPEQPLVDGFDWDF